MTSRDEEVFDALIGEFFADAHKAAVKRLEECAQVLYDDADGENLAAPFCGCEICVVREVIDAAYSDLAHHFLAIIERKIGFRIDFGQDPEKSEKEEKSE